MKRTPAALGFRMPAEWEPHAATWLAWPHEKTDWPGKFPAIPLVYAEIVRWLSLGERVRLEVNGKAEELARWSPDYWVDNLRQLSPVTILR